MNIGIVGCGGRMGRMLIETVMATDGVIFNSLVQILLHYI